MKFEWDEIKEQRNIQNHGLDFSTAALVFGDDYRLEYYDDESDPYEDRFFTIGYVHEVIVVVYTMRADRYRIISARIATNKEKERYHGR